jgi:hypothetical protein
VPLREAFEQVVAQTAELSAKLARTIIRAMRNVLEIMVLSSSLFLLAFVYLARNFRSWPKNGCHCPLNPCSRQCETTCNPARRALARAVCISKTGLRRTSRQALANSVKRWLLAFILYSKGLRFSKETLFFEPG